MTRLLLSVLLCFVVCGCPAPGPSPDPPGPDLSRDAAEWLKLVPDAARGEALEHPVSGEKLTRQQVVGRQIVSVADAAAEAGSVAAVDVLLSAGLTAALGPRANDWRGFTDAMTKAQDKLKANGVTVAQYGQALRSIGAALP